MKYIEYIPQPTLHYPHLNTLQILDACGFIPSWVETYSKEDDGTQDIKSFMEEVYGFGALHEMVGGTVNEDLTYSFPEDPDMHPLVHMKLGGGQELVQYPYGMVAMRDSADQPWFMTRMD